MCIITRKVQGLTIDEINYWRLSGSVMRVMAKVMDFNKDTISHEFDSICAAYGPLPRTDCRIRESLHGRMISAGSTGKASQHEEYVGPERGGHVGGKGKKLGGRVNCDLH